MRQLFSRRGFMQTAVSGLALAAYARPCLAAPGNLLVRKSALQLQPNDPVFAQYAQAVKAMHALPPADKRSWWQQAKIHADFCIHGDPGFLPWHRNYINQFEQICGQLIGDSTFAASLLGLDRQNRKTSRSVL